VAGVAVGASLAPLPMPAHGAAHLLKNTQLGDLAEIDGLFTKMAKM
jgi:hypothetical protein